MNRELILRLPEDPKYELPIVLTFSLERREHIIILVASNGEREWNIASINGRSGELYLPTGIGSESGLCLDETGRIVVREP